MFDRARSALLAVAALLTVACNDSVSGCEYETYAHSRIERDALVSQGWSCEGPYYGLDGQPIWSCTQC